MTIVREDLSIDDMLVTAARYRPDLPAIRTLVEPADADVGRLVNTGDLVQAATSTRTTPLFTCQKTDVARVFAFDHH